MQQNQQVLIYPLNDKYHCKNFYYVGGFLIWASACPAALEVLLREAAASHLLL